MPLYSLSQERIDSLREEVEKEKVELENIKSTSIEDMWKQDIEALEKVL